MKKTKAPKRGPKYTHKTNTTNSWIGMPAYVPTTKGIHLKGYNINGFIKYYSTTKEAYSSYNSPTMEIHENKKAH